MEVGKAEISGQDMDEEMRGEIDGRSGIKGERRREHGKAWRIGKEEWRGRGRGREDMTSSAWRTKPRKQADDGVLGFRGQPGSFSRKKQARR